MTNKEFRKIRKAAKVTQKELADLFEVSTITIHRLENKDGEVPKRMELMLLHALKQQD